MTEVNLRQLSHDLAKIILAEFDYRKTEPADGIFIMLDVSADMVAMAVAAGKDSTPEQKMETIISLLSTFNRLVLKRFAKCEEWLEERARRERGAR